MTSKIIKIPLRCAQQHMPLVPVQKISPKNLYSSKSFLDIMICFCTFVIMKCTNNYKLRKQRLITLKKHCTYTVIPRYFAVRLSRIHDFTSFLRYVYRHYLAKCLEISRKITICEHPKFSLKSNKILIINSIS